MLIGGYANVVVSKKVKVFLSVFYDRARERR